MRILTPAVIMLFLSSCAGSPMQLSSMKPEELMNVDAGNLCNAYAFNQDREVKDELIRRNIITSEEWSIIENRQVMIGMSELALVCSRGGIIPGVNGRINTTTGSWGVRRQYVYESPLYNTNYIYVENGKVTSWQN